MASEKRLIDADKFGMHLADVQLANRGWKDDLCDFLDDVMDALDEQPTVDAVEVVHGRWVHHYNDSGEPIDDKWYCSECHMCNDHKRTWYCPNCGAKMDGDGNA